MQQPKVQSNEIASALLREELKGLHDKLESEMRAYLAGLEDRDRRIEALQEEAASRRSKHLKVSLLSVRIYYLFLIPSMHASIIDLSKTPRVRSWVIRWRPQAHRCGK